VHPRCGPQEVLNTIRRDIHKKGVIKKLLANALAGGIFRATRRDARRKCRERMYLSQRVKFSTPARAERSRVNVGPPRKASRVKRLIILALYASPLLKRARIILQRITASLKLIASGFDAN